MKYTDKLKQYVGKRCTFNNHVFEMTGCFILNFYSDNMLATNTNLTSTSHSIIDNVYEDYVEMSNISTNYTIKYIIPLNKLVLRFDG